MTSAAPNSSKTLVGESGSSQGGGPNPWLAPLTAFQAFTLIVASALHLSGNVHGRGAPFDPDHAGVAEAIIGAVLAVGALVMFRVPKQARAVGLAVTGFAIVGFIVGLNFTARGGDVPDIAYHVIMLPIFLGSFIVLLCRPSRPSQNPATND